MSVFVHMTLSLRSVAFMTNTEQQSCRNLHKAMYILYISDKAKKRYKTRQERVHSQTATFLALRDTRSQSAQAISEFIKHKKTEK